MLFALNWVFFFNNFRGGAVIHFGDFGEPRKKRGGARVISWGWRGGRFFWAFFGKKGLILAFYTLGRLKGGISEFFVSVSLKKKKKIPVGSFFSLVGVRSF